MSSITSPLLLSMGIRDRAALAWIQVKAPLLLSMGMKPIREAKDNAERSQLARAARVGRDHGVVDCADCGPAVRQRDVQAADGTLLRASDVQVTAEVDYEVTDSGPRRVSVRRARRADPMQTLWRFGSISHDQFDAAERLRSDMEVAMPKMGGAAQSDVHLAPWARVGVSAAQIEACGVVRRVMTAVAPRDHLALTWMVMGGGTLTGLAAYAKISDVTAAASLRRALDVVGGVYQAETSKEAAA